MSRSFRGWVFAFVAMGLLIPAAPLWSAECAPPPIETAEVRELRLGVVCYGGVSLAIYMHGVTKEIQRLVVASRALEDVTGAPGPQTNPFAPTRTEHQYFEALRALALEEEVRTEVIVDTIAGTSAGGINGVILAKALAQNTRQQTFRDLWMERGSLTKLLGWGGLRVPLIVVPKLRVHPLRGQAMLQWLVDAIDELDEPTLNPPAYRQGGPTLMPPNTELQLFVTATDLEGVLRTVALTSPAQARERRHARVMQFDYRAGAKNDFGREYNLALAFAARATSSFPGAFRPVSLADVEAAGRKAAATRTKAELEAHIANLDDLFQSDVDDQRALAGLPTEARSTYFIDGGVLDNHPFGPVIDSVARRSIVGREVDRRMLFIEPDPKMFAGPGSGPGKRPSFFGTLTAGFIGARNGDPILDDIRQVQEMNETRGRISDLIASTEQEIFTRLRRIEGVYGPWLSATITPADAARRREAIEGMAESRAGYLWQSYFNVRVTAVVRQFARALSQQLGHPDDSDRAECIRRIVRVWAERNGYLGDDPDPRAQRDLIEGFDIGRLRRRLRFVASGVGELYGQPGAPGRASLDKVRRLLGEHDAKLTGVIRGVTPPGTEIGGQIQALRQKLGGLFMNGGLPCRISDDPGQEIGWQEAAETFVDEHGAEMDAAAELLATVLDGIWKEIHRDLFQQFREVMGAPMSERATSESNEWDRPRYRISKDETVSARDQILARYFGFPFWDALTYPAQSLTRTWEVDDIAVVRISPDDANLLFETRQDKPIKGRSLAHFGAFLKRRFRENDYLWGRLDGVDLLIGLITETGSGMRGDLDADTVNRIKVAGFRSVLAEEQDLRKVDEAKDKVEARIREIENGLPPACSE